MHHRVEAGFLGMYADDAASKHNGSKESDGERFVSALGQVNGRLARNLAEGESPPVP